MDSRLNVLRLQLADLQSRRYDPADPAALVRRDDDALRVRGILRHQAKPPHEQWMHAGKAKVAATKAAEALKNAAPPARSVTKLAGGKMGKVELVEYEDGTKRVRKSTRSWSGHDFKGRPYRVTARAQLDAEELAVRVMEAAGARAPRVQRLKAGQIEMDFVEGRPTSDKWGRAALDSSGRVEREYLALVQSDDGKRMGLADVLMNNFDRHDGNWLVGDDNRLVGIDHGLSWALTGDVDRAPGQQAGPDGLDTRPDGHYADKPPRYARWRDNDLTADDVRVVRRRLLALKPEFERLGRLDWLQFSLARLDLVAAHAKGTRNLIAGTS